MFNGITHKFYCLAYSLSIWIKICDRVIASIGKTIDVPWIVAASEEILGINTQEQVPLTWVVVSNCKNSKCFNMLACTLWSAVLLL